MKVLLKVTLVALTLLYPVIVYFGLKNWDVSGFVVLLLLLAALRWINPVARMGPRWMWVGLLLIVALGMWFFDHMDAVKVYPVLVNLSMLVLFGHSLQYPPTMIERLARIREPDLTPDAIIYTRKVTLTWMIFFGLNGTAAAITGIWASDEIWLLYNGLIAYLLMAGLLAVEWLIRCRVRSGHVR